MTLKMFSNSKQLTACHVQLQSSILWIFLTLAVKMTAVAGSYEGDSCTMRTTTGVCKLASECPELEMAVRAGTFSSRDIVNCGFATHEEIICCPTITRIITESRSDDKYFFEQSENFNTSPTITTSTTTVSPPKDFWSHLLTTTSESQIDADEESTTTLKPDFWLHLLNTTTSASTTTTTYKPLIINGKEVDPNARFIDLTAMLSDKNRQKENDENRATSQNVQVPKPELINDRAMDWQSSPKGLSNPTPDRSAVRFQQFQNDPRNAQQSFTLGPLNVGLNTFVKPQFQQPLGANFGQVAPSRRTVLFPVPNAAIEPTRISVIDPIRESIQQPRQNEWRQGINAPQQLEWQENRDFSELNPISGNILPNYMNPLNDISLPRTPNNPFLNRAMQSMSKATKPTISSKAAKNPIEIVNENLKNAGMEIKRAQVVDKDNDTEKSSWRTTTIRSIISDSFAPFQFRPQPEENFQNENIKYYDQNPIWGTSKSTSRKPPKGREGDRTTRPTTPRTTTTVSSRNSERPAAKACREIDEGLGGSLTPHILGGTPAELGEFPHMAAIGYGSIGNDQGPYDYRCGGTLIASRFVLTAAHCVNNRDSQPAVVLLGLVNLNDEEERRNAEEVRIREVHIHPEYSSSRTYHDIAILELEREIKYSSSIYPTCLYTDLRDPTENPVLYVTGWGQISTATRQRSIRLLKAKLQLVPVSQCNASYVEMGLNRRISQGVQLQQMCAHDPGFTRDACQGDSGGPLNLVVDESLNKYRIIGVISAGFSCGSSTPGLYARVAAYLDYIESIVWPNQS